MLERRCYGGFERVTAGNVFHFWFDGSRSPHGLITQGGGKKPCQFSFVTFRVDEQPFGVIRVFEGMKDCVNTGFLRIGHEIKCVVVRDPRVQVAVKDLNGAMPHRIEAIGR